MQPKLERHILQIFSRDTYLYIECSCDDMQTELGIYVGVDLPDSIVEQNAIVNCSCENTQIMVLKICSAVDSEVGLDAFVDMQ